MNNSSYCPNISLLAGVFLGVFLGMWGCSVAPSRDLKPEADTEIEERKGADKLEISFEQNPIERHYSEGSGNAKLDIVINYPKAKPNSDQVSALANSINHMIETSLVDLIKSYMPEESESTGLEAVLSEISGQLGANYEDAYAKSKIKPQWSISIQGEIVFSNPSLVTFTLSDKVYLGGAHGQESFHLASYRLPEGKRLALSDLVEDQKAATALAEQEFRVIVQIDPGASLREAGYGCEDGNFCVARNLGLTRKGLLLVYNPYDIAPYAEGQVRVLIGYNKLRQLLNPQTKEMLGRLISDADRGLGVQDLGSKTVNDTTPDDSGDSVMPEYLEPEKVQRDML